MTASPNAPTDAPRPAGLLRVACCVAHPAGTVEPGSLAVRGPPWPGQRSEPSTTSWPSIGAPSLPAGSPTTSPAARRLSRPVTVPTPRLRPTATTATPHAARRPSSLSCTALTPSCTALTPAHAPLGRSPRYSLTRPPSDILERGTARLATITSPRRRPRRWSNWRANVDPVHRSEPPPRLHRQDDGDRCCILCYGLAALQSSLALYYKRH